MSHRARALPLALAAALALLVAAPAFADARQKAKASATAECPIFTVVEDDPQAGFDAGRYHRLNFSPQIRSLTCDDTYHIFRSYLYHPRSMRGWTVGPLVSRLRSAEGRRFIKRGSGGRIGFDVWRFTRGSSRTGK
jgi:hypothetical protein